MSYILRSILMRYSVNKLTAFCFQKNVKLNQPCVSNLLTGYTNGQKYYYDTKVDQYIKKLDQDAKRTGHINKHELDDLMTEIKNSKTATGTQSLLIIRCCGNLIAEETPECRTKLVQEIWNMLQELDVPMDISHYNALLRVYLENEHEFSPSEFLADLNKKGVEPNRVTYQRLIEGYCQAGDIKGATRILEFMKEKQLPINENVFNALILGHSNAKDMESAEGIISVMQQAGLEPSAETYTILICGYIKQGNLSKINSIMEHCEKNNIYLIDKDYMEIIYELSVNNHKDYVDQILSKVRKSTGYNQDAKNYIFKLMSAGHTDIAFKVLKTMVRPTRLDGTMTATGNFFISHLVRLNKPIEEIVQYCKLLLDSGMNDRSFLIAMEQSMRNKKTADLALPLFRAAKENGFKIKEHYFWPLLQITGKTKSIDALLDLVTIMTTEFGLPLYQETIRDYVVPHMIRTLVNPDDIIIMLKSCGISTGLAASSIVVNLLNEHKIKQAATLSTKYRSYYSPYAIRWPLVSALINTQDTGSFITILKQICNGIQWAASRNESEETDDEPVVIDHREFIGQVTADVVRQLRKTPHYTPVIKSLLEAYVSAGLALSKSKAELIQAIMQGDITPEIMALLNVLASSDVNIELMEESQMNYYTPTLMDTKTLERLLDVAKSKNQSTNSIKRSLYSSYCRNKDLEKALEMKKELEDDGFRFSDGMHAQLIDCYLDNNEVNKAISYYMALREKEPDFHINNPKTLKLALHLVQDNQLDKAIEFLEIGGEENKTDEFSFATKTLCWQILNTFAEKGDVENVKKFFDLLVKKNYCEVTNVILGPIIKAYVVKGDLLGGLEELSNCAQKYHATPWKNELANKFIQLEDAGALQKITDISTSVHGEVNSLYDLMISFVECGRIRQAKKILETPGLKIRQDRLYNATYKYQNLGAVEHLLNLLELTRDMSVFDRGNIYYGLLVAYGKANEVDKAFSLWTEMQDEDVQPSDEFLILLGETLTRNNRPVPFVIPENVPKKETDMDDVKVSSISQQLRRLVTLKKLEAALELKSKSKIEQFTNTDLSMLVDGLLTIEEFGKAEKIILEMFNAGILPTSRVLTHFLITCMKNGDVRLVEKIGSYLPEYMKSVVSFDNRLAQTYGNAGKAVDYFKQLESKLDQVTSREEYETYMKQFPRSGVVFIVQKQPELLPILERIINKGLLKDSSDTIGSNILWVTYVLLNEYDKAEEIWNRYLQSSDKPLVFKPIIDFAIKNSKPELIRTLINKIKNRTVPMSSTAPLGLCYSRLINIYLNGNQYEEALQTFEEALKEVPIDDFRRKTLYDLKAIAEVKQLPFNYVIPKYSQQMRKSQRYESSDDEK